MLCTGEEIPRKKILMLGGSSRCSSQKKKRKKKKKEERERERERERDYMHSFNCELCFLKVPTHLCITGLTNVSINTSTV